MLELIAAIVLLMGAVTQPLAEREAAEREVYL
jgi:hypothetical protein